MEGGQEGGEMRGEPERAGTGLGGAFRVLLVDDHEIMRRGLASLLHAEPDMELVAQAENGREAIELADSLLPDVVVMDVSMPGMSGTQAARLIKEAHPSIRIVGLSMHSMDGTKEAMRAAGAEDYVTKDGPFEDLLRAIRG
jgi:two-component system response regulator NreC